jgi:hypothetical protein
VSEQCYFAAPYQRVERRWEEGRRARDWPAEDLREALRIHRHQWQETYVRLLLGYHCFDRGEREAALGHLIHGRQIATNYWKETESPRLLLSLEHAFVAARCGRPLDETEALLELAPQAKDAREDMVWIADRARAAVMIVRGDPSALALIDRLDAELRTRPNAEMDNIQAEIDWVQAMRDDFFLQQRSA